MRSELQAALVAGAALPASLVVNDLQPASLSLAPDRRGPARRSSRPAASRRWCAARVRPDRRCSGAPTPRRAADARDRLAARHPGAMAVGRCSEGTRRSRRTRDRIPQIANVRRSRRPSSAASGTIWPSRREQSISHLPRRRMCGRARPGRVLHVRAGSSGHVVPAPGRAGRRRDPVLLRPRRSRGHRRRARRRCHRRVAAILLSSSRLTDVASGAEREEPDRRISARSPRSPTRSRPAPACRRSSAPPPVRSTPA